MWYHFQCCWSLKMRTCEKDAIFFGWWNPTQIWNKFISTNQYHRFKVRLHYAKKQILTGRITPDANEGDAELKGAELSICCSHKKRQNRLLFVTAIKNKRQNRFSCQKEQHQLHTSHTGDAALQARKKEDERQNSAYECQIKWRLIARSQDQFNCAPQP